MMCPTLLALPFVELGLIMGIRIISGAVALVKRLA